ncbi:MAG: hypothetical protein H7175_13020 [Burkholderiales bacterium]|nr:hypothetical protein [Anaerolineae bacterium]
MNEYSILLLNKIYRQEAIQQAESRRLARRGKKAAESKAQPRRVNVMSVAWRCWSWVRQIRLVWNWQRPLALKNETGC